MHANDVEMVLDAVRQSRFAPAQTPLGRTVAVNMVWLIFMTTVETPDPQGDPCAAVGRAGESGAAGRVDRRGAAQAVRSDRDVNDGLIPAPALLPARSPRC